MFNRDNQPGWHKPFQQSIHFGVNLYKDCSVLFCDNVSVLYNCGIITSVVHHFIDKIGHDLTTQLYNN